MTWLVSFSIRHVWVVENRTKNNPLVSGLAGMHKLFRAQSNGRGIYIHQLCTAMEPHEKEEKGLLVISYVQNMWSKNMWSNKIWNQKYNRVSHEAKEITINWLVLILICYVYQLLAYLYPLNSSCLIINTFYSHPEPWDSRDCL